MNAVDIAIILVYLLGMTFLGIWFSGRQKSIDEFFKARRGLSWLPLGISLMAAMNSGTDYLTQPSAVMRYGFILVVIPSLLWLVLYVYVTRICVPFYTRLNFFSAYEYLENRFDGRIRTLSAVIFIFWRLCWMGTALYVPCLAIHSVSRGKIPLVGVVAVVGVTVTVFCMLGGFRAVVWTQVLQFIIMFVGLAVTVGVIMSNLSGDWRRVFADASAEGRWWFVATPSSADPVGAWEHLRTFFCTDITLVGLVFSSLLYRMTAYTSDQIMVQRLAAARSEREAAKSFFINASTDSAWMIVLGFIGLAMFAYVKQTGFGNELARDQVFPAFIGEFFPIGLKGLVVSAILAASLSCVEGGINACAGIVISDFYKRSSRNNQTEVHSETTQRRDVMVSRLATVALGLATTLLASNVGRQGELYVILNRVNGLFVGPIFALFCLGMFTRRANSWGVLCGGIIGPCLTFYVVFYTDISFLWTCPLGLAATFLPAYLVSCFLGKTSPDQLGWTFRRITRNSVGSA